METMVRTHVMLPKALLEEADGRLGNRKRSELITSLLAEWVRRERLSAAIDAVLAHQPGPLDDNVPEEWKTSEGAAKWVHDLRNEWDQRGAGSETANGASSPAAARGQ